MSEVQPAARIPLQRLRSWRIGIAVFAAALVAAGLAVSQRTHLIGSTGSHQGNPSAAGQSSGGQPASAGGGNQSVGGVTGAGGHGGATGNGKSASGKGTANVTPGHTPQPTANLVDGVTDNPQVRQSNCASGYYANETCTVYQTGVVYLHSQPTGTLVPEVVIDGKVVAQKTYSAKQGGYRWASLLTFTVPPGAREIDYVAILQDSGGHELARSRPVQTFVG